MKISARDPFCCALAALAVLVGSAAFAQEARPEAAPKSPPSEPTAGSTSAAQPAQPAAPAAEQPPASEPPPAAKSADPSAAPAEAVDAAAAPTPEPAEPQKAPASTADDRIVMSNRDGRDRVVPVDSRQSHAIRFFGSVVVDGHVTEHAASIFGNTTINGSVGENAAAVFGRVYANGPVGGNAVAVFGGLNVDEEVGGKAVAVFGNVNLGPNANVKEEVVSVFGRVNRHRDAVVGGDINEILPVSHVPGIRTLKIWARNCLKFLRPLAFSRGLEPVWMVAGAIFAFYVLLAIFFRTGVEKCVVTLEQRPAMSIFAAVLSILLTPLVLLLVMMTGIGLLLVPGVLAIVLFASLFGRAVIHAWFGRRITRSFAKGPFAHVATSVFIGSIIVALLYCVPVLGLIVWMLIGTLGMGVVFYTLLLGMKKEKAPAAMVASTEPAGVPGIIGGSALIGVPPVVAAGHGSPSASALMGMLRASPAPAPMPTPPAATLTRAGFWSRMMALFIDVVLIGILCQIARSALPENIRAHFNAGTFLIILAAYGAVLWKLRGATIGGIVCDLKLVQLDDRPLDWTTCIVRAVACFLSLAVAGLGFIWAAFDRESQTWHDKIAGTIVIKQPKRGPAT